MHQVSPVTCRDYTSGSERNWDHMYSVSTWGKLMSYFIVQTELWFHAGADCCRAGKIKPLLNVCVCPLSEVTNLVPLHNLPSLDNFTSASRNDRHDSPGVVFFSLPKMARLMFQSLVGHYFPSLRCLISLFDISWMRTNQIKLLPRPLLWFLME